MALSQRKVLQHDLDLLLTVSVFCHIYVITARVRSTREGNVLTSVCPSIHPSVCPRGGYPYPIMLCNISQNAMRQRGGTWTPPPGGVPGSGTPPRGVPRPPRGGTRVRYPPGGYLDPPGGVPGSGTPQGVPGPPWGGYLGQVPPLGGVTRVRYPPRGGYPGRTTEGVLTTRRAVCLLRSRRRTFLSRYFFFLIVI